MASGDFDLDLDVHNISSDSRESNTTSDSRDVACR